MIDTKHIIQLTKNIEKYNFVHIFIGTLDDNIFKNNLNLNILKQILDYYVQHYKYQNQKYIRYTFGSYKMSISNNKTNITQTISKLSPIKQLSDRFDYLILLKNITKKNNDNFTCLKNYHNIENIQHINIQFNDQLKLIIEINGNNYSIYIEVDQSNLNDQLENINNILANIKCYV
jgi:hypothetical protein